MDGQALGDEVGGDLVASVLGQGEQAASNNISSVGKAGLNMAGFLIFNG